MTRREWLAGTAGAAGALAWPAAAARGQAGEALREAEHALGDDMARWRTPGASYAILRGGRIVAHAVGVRRAGKSLPVTPDTPFQAASLSKTVAAAVALVLVQRGRLALDAAIARYTGGWRLPPSPFSDGHDVTLRRLLAMTGGINVPGFLGYPPGAPLPTLRQILDGAPPANSDAVRVIARPGTRMLYSGGGYEIAEAAMEGAAGAPFARLARETVLGPAGMARSGFDQPLEAERWPDAAAGHDPEGRVMAGGGNVLPELAAAGLWSTPSDLARFLLALSASSRGEPGALIARETMGQMLAPVDGFGYGLGGVPRGSGRGLAFLKRGHNIGFHCLMLLFPDSGNGIVVMTNGENGDHALEPFVERVAAAEQWLPLGSVDE